MKIAGSREAFWQIDHDYVLHAATIAKQAGVSVFIYNSSLGADAQAKSFYLQVKGKVENDLAALGFSTLGIVRPSFLDGGARPEKRPGEAIAIFFAKMLAPLIPKRYRAVSTSKVASAMWALAKSTSTLAQWSLNRMRFIGAWIEGLWGWVLLKRGCPKLVSKLVLTVSLQHQKI